jgi:hypothetical protein
MGKRGRSDLQIGAAMADPGGRDAPDPRLGRAEGQQAVPEQGLVRRTQARMSAAKPALRLSCRMMPCSISPKGMTDRKRLSSGRDARKARLHGLRSASVKADHLYFL